MSSNKNTSAVHYSIDASHTHSHLFKVSLLIAEPQAGQVVSLPVWIPGSYLIRDFAKNLQRLKATQGGKHVATHQDHKSQWLIQCKEGQALQLSYEVYAFDNSVRSAWLDTQRGFFNGTSLCLRVHGQEERPHALTLTAIKGSTWLAATGLQAAKVNKQGFGDYVAANYDELVDCPFELGNFWRGEFTACGIPHEFVVAGAMASFDGAKLIADTQKICETQIKFWHEKKPATSVPYKRYVFMLNAVEEGYGGLEHRNSTALICNRRDLPALGMKKMPDSYVTLLGLISHEYFHTWNVKQLRPAEFARYDYTQENYTELLWFFEGFTSYYDDLQLLRSKTISLSRYLELLTNNWNGVLLNPGCHKQTVADSSFDAWTKYYQMDENTPNAVVSYYAKGALIALGLDLVMRHHSSGKISLDDLMRYLWKEHGKPFLGINQYSLDLAISQIMGITFNKIWQDFKKNYINGTQDLPLQLWLTQIAGISVSLKSARFLDDLKLSLGIRHADSHGWLKLTHVLDGGLAQQAGLAPHDLISSINGQRVNSSRLDPVLASLKRSKRLSFHYFRQDKEYSASIALKLNSPVQYEIKTNKSNSF